ncbi:hybrid sensor histidine kinase/response regulator [Desulfoferula mesophila]|uniref:histidine kinase n=1 Tax=Desulfoferula mesophila TaxID=3058419 RepID=A0AAU9F3Y3_9BACT|nr:hypothetical protein FAK_37780 [Desulfoferula mesophilus]
MRTSHKIIALAVGLGLFIWFADGLTDYIWFYKGSLLGLLLTEVPAHELYIRLLILVCFVGFGVVAGGIVERLQKARTQLSASRQWLSTTLTSIGDAVIVTDRQGRVSFLNPTAEGLTGWRASEARGRPLHEVFNIINEYTLRPVASPVDKVLAEGIVVGLANHTLLVSKDGRRAPIEDSGAPIKTAEGKVDGVVLVFRDVSGRRKAEEERARLDDQLKQSQKLESLGTLAGGLAHEFNNILTVMMGYGEAALGQARNGVVDIADLEQVLAAGRKGHSLVSGIMTYSRRQEARVGPLDLNRTVRDAAELLGHALPKAVTVQLDLAPGLGKMLGDAVQLEHVLINLATNARDAMPQGGLLTVSTSAHASMDDCGVDQAQLSSGPYLRLRVRDQGQGMDEATQERVFEPFFTTKEAGRGTGLGLSTVYGIVNSLGGRIVCQSEPGQGTCFDLYFPVCQNEGQAPAPASSAELPDERERVLVVDDEPAILNLGHRLLTEAGYRVEVAAGGEEALARFRANGGFDLVVLDISMPGMDGRTCLKRLRELSPEVKVVLASGYAPQELMEEMSTLGLQGFAAKPFLRGELLKAVRAALEQA